MHTRIRCLSYIATYMLAETWCKFMQPFEEYSVEVESQNQ